MKEVIKVIDWIFCYSLELQDVLAKHFVISLPYCACGKTY